MDIQARNKKELTVNVVGVGVYNVPLPASLSPVELAGFIRARKAGEGDLYIWLVEFFRRYMGDALDAVDAEQFNEITRAWDTGGDPTAGESLASPAS